MLAVYVWRSRDGFEPNIYTFLMVGFASVNASLTRNRCPASHQDLETKGERVSMIPREEEEWYKPTTYKKISLVVASTRPQASAHDSDV